MWRFRFLGMVDATRPDGTTVVFPTRKVAGLLVVLVIARGRPVERQELGEILWPDADTFSRSANLRKAISLLRVCLGEGAPLKVGRENLVWSGDSDCDALKDNAEGQFCPDFNEPWFLEWREEFERIDVDDDRKVIGAYLQTLQWVSATTPDRVLQIMRATPELTLSLHPRDLYGLTKSIVANLAPGDPMAGWAYFFRAVSTGHFTFLNLDEAIRDCRRAVELAEQNHDFDLFSEASHVLAGMSIVAGSAQSAIKMADRLVAFGESRGHNAAVGRSLHVRALAQYHMGQTSAGWQTMDAAKNHPFFVAHPLEQGHVTSHQALFSATSGAYDLASRRLDEARGVLDNFPNWRLRMCCSLVDGIISQGIGESESAQKKLRPMIANADEAGAYAFSIYGLETLAQSARTEKDKELMKDSLTKALGYRRSTAMRYTQWDAKRLEGVAIVRSG